MQCYPRYDDSAVSSLNPDVQEYAQYLKALFSQTDESTSRPQLLTDYIDGVQCVRHNSPDQTRQLWTADLSLANSPEAQTFVLENLCWLDLFTGAWDMLATDTKFLLNAAPWSSVGLYASASLAFREHQFDVALTELNKIDEAFASPVLRTTARTLRTKITVRQETREQVLRRQSTLQNFTRDEQEIYLSQASYHVQSNADLYLDVFRSQISNCNDLISCLRSWLKQQPQQEAYALLPQLLHIFFRSRWAYHNQYTSPDEDNSDRCFESRQYNCADYAMIMAKVLKPFGIESRLVSYYSSPENLGHMFVAFKVDNSWGFGNPSSFHPARFKTLDDVLNQWGWANDLGEFVVRET